MIKFQLYGVIKDYFGSEIVLYFVWFGFYMVWLVFFVIVGFVVFLYGIGLVGSYFLVKDVCDDKNKDVWYMCLLCDRQCSYWDLVFIMCIYVYVIYFFDNDWIVGFVFIVLIWVILFFEFWKCC